MFGCQRCIPEEPHHATELGLVELARLVDIPHFVLKVRGCAHCGQRFVWVYTERIDWQRNEELPSWTVLPITGDEAEALIAADAVDLEAIQALGRTRRFLRDDETSFEYRFGIVIGDYERAS